MKADKELIRAQYEKVWPNNKKMQDWGASHRNFMAILEGGFIVTAPKVPIDKDFCFGWGMSQEHSEATKQCRMARESYEYFRKKNRDPFDHWIDALTTEKNIVLQREFWKQPDDCMLASLSVDMGPNGVIRELTKEDRMNLIAMYDEANKAHNKRVETYLKKYGLRNVRTWTYYDLD